MENPRDEETEYSDSEEPVYRFYVVGYNGQETDAKVMGPFFLDEEEGSANYFLTEFYSSRYYDKVMVFMVRDSVKVRKHEVMQWERHWERLGFCMGQVFAQRDVSQNKLVRNAAFNMW